MKKVFWTVFSLLLFTHTLNAAVCPAHTHKDDATQGLATNLPSGYFIYRFGYDDIVKSPINEYDPTPLVENAGGIINSLEITEDGMWILYSNAEGVYVMNHSGGEHTKLNVNIPKTDYGTAVYPHDIFFSGWLRNSPTGNTEIWYTTGYIQTEIQEVWAVQVNLSGTPSVDTSTTRKILDLTASEATLRNLPDHQMQVYRDQIWAAVEDDGGTGWYGAAFYSMFVTIPNSGLGTADLSDMYVYSDSNRIHIWGCGHAMSQDGELVAANSGVWGNECVPNLNQTPGFDHKGIFVTKFRRKGDLEEPLHRVVDENAESINWVQSKYRFGDWDEMDHSSWAFSNDRDYIIGRQAGFLAPDKGVWVLEWNTNVWTPVTPLDSASQVLAEIPRMFVGTPGEVLNSSTTVGSSSSGDTEPRVVIYNPSEGDVLKADTEFTLYINAKAPSNGQLKMTDGRIAIDLLRTTEGIDPYQQQTYEMLIPSLVDDGTGTYINTMEGKQWYFVFTVYGDATVQYKSGKFTVGTENSLTPFDTSEAVPVLKPDAQSGQSILIAGQKQMLIPVGVQKMTIYDNLGRVLWQKSVNYEDDYKGEANHSLMIPAEFRNTAYLVKFH